MTISRIRYATRFSGPETLVVAMLVAGVPVVLLPGGVMATSTAVSDGTVDPLWWPGVGALTATMPGPVEAELARDWLDPEAVFEVFKSTDAVRGDAKVEALTVELLDAFGEATALLSASGARVGHLLAAPLSDTSTSVELAASRGVPSSGPAWIGREAILYSGVSGTTLTGCTRGVFGTRARARVVDPNGPAVVTFGDGPRHWYGRLASVWLCRLVGTVLVDPSCIYVGTVGPGVQRTRNGARWSVPIDNVVEVLQRKIARTSVAVMGICHLNTARSERSPLAGIADLGDSSGAPDRDGWHPTWETFIADWDRAARAATPSGWARYTGSAVQLQSNLIGAGVRYTITAPWNEPPTVELSDDDGDASVYWSSQSAPPNTVVFFDGYVPLPVPGDLAKLPATLSFAVADALAQYTLTVEKTAAGDPLPALVLATGTNRTVDWVRVTALTSTGTDHVERRRRTLVTDRCSATLGILAQGTALDALQAAALALDALDGGMHEADTIDWAQIEAQFAAVPLGALPSQRRYLLHDGDVLLDTLTQELRLRGMALCTRWGRLGAFRTAAFASSEEASATIDERDVLTDEDGTPIEPEVIDSLVPVATSATFTLPGGGSFQWFDTTARAEFGDGSDVRCTALEHVHPTVDLTALPGAIQQTAQQILGVVAVPYRCVRVTLGPRFFGLQEGDLVLFSHPRVPTLDGTIGVMDATCQVQAVRMQVMGGRGRIEVLLRAQDSDLAGYAPEALVAAAGLTVAGGLTTVTVDTSTPWGPACFARATRPDGSASVDALDGFAAGQRVRLSQIGTRTPIADEGFTVISVDHVANVMVLSGEASAEMLDAAAIPYGVMVRFAAWPTIDDVGGATALDQERYLFIADHVTGDLGEGDPAKRWAS